ncbi:MAG: hypothetical protein LBB60_05435, partial [Desulfovibrio sp.]|nr:hypothetical protein [Desulfovibrio sp.]
MSDFSTGCMGLWSPESDMRVAAQHARHENEMLQLEMETQAKIQEIQANTHANEMSRMMDKYNEVVDKYNKLAGRAWIFQAERDTAYE